MEITLNNLFLMQWIKILVIIINQMLNSLIDIAINLNLVIQTKAKILKILKIVVDLNIVKDFTILSHKNLWLRWRINKLIPNFHSLPLKIIFDKDKDQIKPKKIYLRNTNNSKTKHKNLIKTINCKKRSN